MGQMAAKGCATLSGVPATPLLRSVLWVTALAAALVTSLGAQSPAIDLEAYSRIVKEASDPSHVLETAAYLTDVYGPRLTGSPHLRGAGDYVVQRLKSWGVSARVERWGPFGPGWTTDRFVAMAVAPTPFPLLAFPKAWTPGTQGPVVATATLAVIAREQDFATYKGRLKGQFVLVAPAVTTPAAPARVGGPRLSDADLRALTEVAETAVAPAQTTNRTALEFARRRMAFFVNEGVAALIEPGGWNGTVVVGDGRLRDESAFAGQGFYPWPDEVATQVVIATEQYNRIVRLLERRIAVTLEMEIASNYHTADPDSFNIVAEIPGGDLAAEVVMLGAHFDSAHGGTGATDNAAGCAAVLEAMRILKASGVRPRRTIRAMFWTGGEQGHLGARWYVTQHFADPAFMEVRPEHALLSAYFGLDGGAGAIRGLYLQGNLPSAAVFERWLAPLRSRGVATLSPRVTREGDHRAFDAVGLPAFDFIQDPGNSPEVRHSNLDTFDRLNASDLTHNAVVVAWLAYQAATDRDRLPRKPLPPPDRDAAGPWSPGR